eukprot:c1285_g1_i1 orf=241-528(+)
MSTLLPGSLVMVSTLLPGALVVVSTLVLVPELLVLTGSELAASHPHLISLHLGTCAIRHQHDYQKHAEELEGSHNAILCKVEPLSVYLGRRALRR